MKSKIQLKLVAIEIKKTILNHLKSLNSEIPRIINT
jgi:hypothetical protein